MTYVRNLDLDNDFNDIRTLDSYLNGTRDEQTVLEEYEKYPGNIYVAENEDGHITGIVSISLPHWNRIFMIDHLAVIETHRRTGIGKKLIAFILGKARELKARFVSVQTAAWNTDSIAFYESLGFKKRTALPEYFGEKNDMIWLEIDLRISNRGQ